LKRQNQSGPTFTKPAMKKFIFTLLLFIFFYERSFSQSCLPEGITFTTQAQIDSFQVNYPGCMEIEGDVYISNSNITNLNGLNVLSSIGGNLAIDSNDLLPNLTGLNDIISIGGNLKIEVNAALTSLTGLNNVTYIGNGFNLGYFEGEGNPSLTNLKGMEGLTSVRHMYINDNSALTSLTGLDNLTTIEGVLSIGTFPPGNHSLKSLTGLESLVYIGDALEVGFNDSLTSLTGLDNVEANTLSDLYIYWNSSLSNCAVQSICDFLAAPNGTVEIHDNATGCNSAVEVDSACIYLYNSDVNDFSSFLIYPNPTSTHIKIELPNSTKPVKNIFLTITDINGQQMIERQISEPQTVVDVYGLKAGIYFVKVTDKNTVRMGKFVKN
jgi:hypothetical protein